MSRQSWAAWTVSAPMERASKQRNVTGEGATDLYVDITCPNCGDVFEATHASVAKNKSHVCKAHLAKRKCNIAEDERSGDDSNAMALPPSKRSRMAVVAHQQCNKRIDALERRVNGLEQDRDMFVDSLVNGFSLSRPLTHENVVPKIQLKINETGSAMVTTPVAPAQGYQQLVEENVALKENLKHALGKVNWVVHELKRWRGTIPFAGWLLHKFRDKFPVSGPPHVSRSAVRFEFS